LKHGGSEEAEEIGTSEKSKSSPRRRGDAEKNRESGKTKTFETQRKGGSGGARNLPLINADDTDQKKDRLI
jgi:hypothetical protein